MSGPKAQQHCGARLAVARRHAYRTDRRDASSFVHRHPHSVPSRLAQSVASLLLAATLATACGGAERLEGRPLRDWVAQLDGNPTDVRQEAARVLVLGAQSRASAARSVAGVLGRDAMGQGGAELIARLEQLPRGGAERARIAERVGELLGDESPAVRAGAVRALGYAVDGPKSPTPPAHLVATIAPALADRDSLVRAAAAEVIGRAGASAAGAWGVVDGAGANAAVRMLAAVSHDRVSSVRLAAVLALSHLAASARDSLFGERVRSDSAPGAAGRHEAARRAAQPLVAALHDDDERVRFAAAYAVASLAPTDLLGDPAARAAVAAKAVAPLRAALADEHASMREAAAVALGRFGAAARPAAPELARLAAAPDSTARGAAVRALASICGGAPRASAC